MSRISELAHQLVGHFIVRSCSLLFDLLTNFHGKVSQPFADLFCFSSFAKTEKEMVSIEIWIDDELKMIGHFWRHSLWHKFWFCVLTFSGTRVIEYRTDKRLSSSIFDDLLSVHLLWCYGLFNATLQSQKKIYEIEKKKKRPNQGVQWNLNFKF